LTYGLRGVSYYALEIKGAGQDLHSGVFGTVLLVCSS
jgi:Cys-Gly metallodipeptidase DUG1